jgi:hypothetical protein
LVMAVPFLLSWLRLATSSSARFGAASPYLFVRKIPYVINLVARAIESTFQCTRA